LQCALCKHGILNKVLLQECLTPNNLETKLWYLHKFCITVCVTV